MRSIDYFFYKHYPWLLPILWVALITPLTPSIDKGLESYFYAMGPNAFSSNPFFVFIYKYGMIPGNLLFIGAFILFPLSFFFSALKRWRSSLLLLILTMALGAGLITHAILKDHWGRPRPRQVVEYGGSQQFRPYWEPNFFRQPEPSKSFPCGHCSTGFYFFALALVGRKFHNKKVYYGAMLFALVWGSLLGLTRMAQGGHFFSDVLLSALVMWLTAYWTNRLLERYYERIDPSAK